MYPIRLISVIAISIYLIACLSVMLYASGEEIQDDVDEIEESCPYIEPEGNKSETQSSEEELSPIISPPLKMFNSNDLEGWENLKKYGDSKHTTKSQTKA